MGQLGQREVFVSNVVNLNCSLKTEWHKDLDEYEAELARAKPFSGEKGHFLKLLMLTAQNKNLPADIRHRACSLVWTYSEVRQFLSSQLIACSDYDSEDARWSAEAMKNWAVR